MSALAAVLSFHHPSSSVERLQRLLDFQQHAGPDGQRRVSSGPCALGLCVMTTTPEDHIDAPCVHDVTTNLLVAIDGFVSNRDSLAGALDIGGGELGRIGDARLIARAYQRWNLEAFAKIEGEFCVALWDVRTNTCVIARDIFGIRPAYYSHGADALCAASELQALHADRPTAINEGMVAEALVWRRTSLDETLFTGIKRIPPAHLVVARPDGTCDVRRYWTPDLDTTLILSSDEDYAEACRERVKSAVAAALRSDRPVSLMLSGGLDSGIVAAQAAALRPHCDHVHAFTVSFPGLAVDETAWARETATHTNTPWAPVPPGANDYDFVAESRATKNLPSFPSGANSVGIRHAAVRMGSRVLLTGMGGDEWFYGSDWRYADLLTRGRVWQWGSEVWADRKVYAVSWRRLLRDSLLPMIPRQRWKEIGKILGRVSDRGLISEHFAARVNLDERLDRDWIPSARAHARRDLGREFFSGLAVAAHEEMAQLSALTGTIHRHPLYNRQLVTFAMALPEEQRRYRGVTKRIMRHAYAHALPADVIARVEGFTYDFIVTEVIRRLLRGGLFHKPLVVEQGWVDAAPLEHLVDAVSHGPADGSSARAALRLWPTASVEVWLNSVLR